MTTEPPNTMAHAEREIAIARKLVGDDLTIEPFIPHIMVLTGAFLESGQSGHSAPHTAAAIVATLERLMMYRPLTPLTGEEGEWRPGTPRQNLRDSRVFLHGDGRVTFNEGLAWVDEKGHGFHGLASGVSSQTDLILPCSPLTRYVQVTTHEVAPGSWEFRIADPTERAELQASQGILPDIMEP